MASGLREDAIGLSALSGIKACARAGRLRQANRLFGGGVLVLFALGAGCSQKFSDDCSNTRSCDGSSEGGEGGEGGADDGAGGTSSNSGGSSGTVGAAGASGGSGESCADGCGDDETCCDGECVDTSSDAANCGACGKACEGDNAELACVDSKCSIASCEEGYVDCSDDEDGCETEDVGSPGAPAPFLPMAGAYTGAVRAEKSLKPKFAWRAPEEQGSCSGFTYEIELTRECVPGKLQECAFEEPDVHESGIEATEWTPSETLPVSDVVPVGALYAWRVRACDAPEHCSAWSRVSYVNVGRLIDDINADGYSDLVELGGGARAWFSPGDALSPLASSSVVQDSTIGSALTPRRGRFLGDVNGDGFPDMLLWDISVISVTNPPVLLFGASTLGAWSSAPVPQQTLAYSRSGRVGDLDADGFADVAMSEIDAESASQKPSVLRLYRGRSGFTWSSPVIIGAPGGPSSGFGAALVGGLDSNRDGYSDLFVLDDAKGALHLAYGAPSLPTGITSTIESEALVTVHDEVSDLMVLGDRNADGYDDVAAYVTNVDDPSENSTIQVFLGGVELAQQPAATLLVNARHGLEWFGGYDLGGDGRADLILISIHDDTYGSYQGLFRALPGSSMEQSATDLVQVGDLGSTLAGSGLSGGDYDGDGVIDLTVRVQSTNRKVLRGGKVAPTSETCSQPSTSFQEIGDWCSVESSKFAIPSKYSNPNMTVR